MFKLGKIKIFIYISIVISIISAIITVSWIYYRNLPQSVPRNVKIMVNDDISRFITLLELNDATFEAVVFGNFSNRNFEEGFILENYSIEDFELLDETLLDDFAESFTISGLYSNIINNTRSSNIVIDRWSMELSPQQLNEVWLLLDIIVKNDKAPTYFIGTSHPTVRVIIDDRLYWGLFHGGEEFLSYNFNFPREQRRSINEYSDINLLRLTHHLADIAPIRMSWERPPFFLPE
jgi:hypothetical protein